MVRQSLFEDSPTTILDLKLKSRILYINYKDIVFSPLSQLLCQNCGQFGRTFRCPPFVMKYSKTKEYLKQFNKFLLIISESDEEKILERYKHEREYFKAHEYKSWFYAGTAANAENLGKIRNDIKDIVTLLKNKYNSVQFYSPGGGCGKCRPCKIHLHQLCSHPKDVRASMEGSGIDVYATLKNIKYEVQTPPITKYISVCFVVWNDLLIK